jgi:hypothetical protein
LCLWNPGRDLEDVYSERWFGAVHVSRRALVGWLFVIESRQRIGEMTGSDQVPRGLVRLAKKRRAPRCHPPCSGNLLPQRFLGSTWGTRTRSEGNQTNPGCILIVPRCDSQTTALLQARLRMQVREPGREDSQTKNVFVPMYLFRISLCRIHHPPPAARIPAAQRWGDANCLGHFNLTCPAEVIVTV